MLYMKQKVTNRIYVYTAAMEGRDDMEPYVMPDPDKRDFSNAQLEIEEGAGQSTKDWRKITKKSDLAAFAFLTDAIVLEENETLMNMRAQYVSALQARNDGKSAADAVADQVRIAGGKNDKSTD